MADTNTNKDKDTDQTVSLLQQALIEERAAREKVERDNAALVAEFDNAETYEEQMEVAKNAYVELLPLAIINIQGILGDNQNESTTGTRASLSKHVLETVVNGKLDLAGESEVTKLLKEMAKKAPTDDKAAKGINEA